LERDSESATLTQQPNAIDIGQNRAQENVTPGLQSNGMNPQLSSIDDGYDSDTIIKFRKDVDKQLQSMKKECFR